MLNIAVELLAGRYYAGDYSDRDKAEWPPHPGRLYSALQATHFHLGGKEETKKALCWLEEQKPPSIVCSEAQFRSVSTAFVPVNDQSTLKEHRLKQPRTFPCAIPEVPLIQFIWGAKPDKAIYDALNYLVEHLSYLGTSKSAVCSWISTDKPEPNYIPSIDGNIFLRVPTKGRFQEQEDIFELGLDPRARPANGQFYKSVNKCVAVEPEPLANPYWDARDFYVFTLHGKSAQSVESTLILSSSIRKALLSLVGDSAPDILHGHGKGQHLAFLPLPFVGLHEHANGQVPGFAVALPKGIDFCDRQKILETLFKLKKLNFNGQCFDVSSGANDPRKTLQPSRWVQASKYWESVTPVVFDRHPRKSAGNTKTDILCQACRNMGLPDPVNIHISKQSCLSGVPSSEAFKVIRKKGEPFRPFFHISLEFDRPVYGPIVLGAKRFFGLGLFAPEGLPR
ncbi:type I-G CRISPR-associated protein Csb2 [Endozoicomonas sp. ALB032]|uniref:type I-G CRISPR-associated protein Csb2 n=1 Tax=Endozoicomonas sp. ALB032 TaxID=3403082 RepID=UPI003BB50566